MSAALTELAVRMFAFNVYHPSIGWPVIVLTLYAVPIRLVAGGLAILLQHRRRSAPQ